MLIDQHTMTNPFESYQYRLNLIKTLAGDNPYGHLSMVIKHFGNLAFKKIDGQYPLLWENVYFFMKDDHHMCYQELYDLCRLKHSSHAPCRLKSMLIPNSENDYLEKCVDLWISKRHSTSIFGNSECRRSPSIFGNSDTFANDEYRRLSRGKGRSILPEFFEHFIHKIPDEELFTVDFDINYNTKNQKIITSIGTIVKEIIEMIQYLIRPNNLMVPSYTKYLVDRMPIEFLKEEILITHYIENKPIVEKQSVLYGIMREFSKIPIYQQDEHSDDIILIITNFIKAIFIKLEEEDPNGGEFHKQFKDFSEIKTPLDLASIFIPDIGRSLTKNSYG